MKYFLGLDLGSVSLDCVILNDEKEIIYQSYRRTNGRPVQAAAELFAEMLQTCENIEFSGVCVTGSGKELIASQLSFDVTNEIIAHATAAWTLYPGTKYIIEIGGQDSKFITIGTDSIGRHYLKDHAFNELCAAGPGAFLDQQAQRLGLTTEELGNIAFAAKNVPSVAGRCSVFAKSDMIHLQQKGVPKDEIAAGLCFSLARNYLSALCRGKLPQPPILFQGGVAANKGVVRAFREILNLNENELMIPENFGVMGAIGAALTASENAPKRFLLSDIAGNFSETFDFTEESDLEPLKTGEIPQSIEVKRMNTDLSELFLGIDVGSVSTKGALIDKNRNVVASAYLPTAGKPLEALEKVIAEINAKAPCHAPFAAVAATGSGRVLAAKYLKTGLTVDEISAQSVSCGYFFPECDTIIEIGGQDSKFIKSERGAVSNFKMNRACAAGTGSFLEEQSNRLKISIKDEFSDLAFASKHPVKLGSRCTVFMDSDLVHHLQRGAKTEDLCAGLAYATCENYIEKVAGSSKFGENIVFQGGVAKNRAAGAVFEKLLKTKIKIHPYPEISGAIGAAFFAMEEHSAPEKDENKSEAVNGFGIRDELLLSYLKEYEENPHTPCCKGVIAMPFALNLKEFLPFWAAFFGELNYEIVLSPETDSGIVQSGLIHVPAEFCYPVKVLFGHVQTLLDKGFKRIFIPHMQFFEPPKKRLQYACPYTQAVPYIVRENMKSGAEILTLKYPVEGEENFWIKNTAETLGLTFEEVDSAFVKARAAQREFANRCIDAGKKIIEKTERENGRGVVLLGRPYNTGDRHINLNIAERLKSLGISVIPADFLPLDSEELPPVWDRVRWGYGRKLVKAARILKKHKNLGGVIVTNFGCGPDAFIDQYLEYELSDTPHLVLEFDDHRAEAGLVTRLEAFSRNFKIAEKERSVVEGTDPGKPKRALREYTYYIPSFMDHALAISGALKASGCKVVLLPPTDDESWELGLKYAYGRECHPFISFVGDLLKAAKRPDFIPEKACYFGPSYFGACLLPQYIIAMHLVLKRLGLGEVTIMNITDETNMKELGPAYLARMALGIYAIDRFFKWKTEIEPYEAEGGSVEKVYREVLSNIETGLEKGSFFKAVKRGVKAMKSIKLTAENGNKPKIGVVGDVYTRINAHSNGRLFENLKNTGFEVWPSCSMIDLTFMALELKSDDFLREGKKVKSILAKGTFPAVRICRHLIDRYFPDSIRTPQERDLNFIKKTVGKHIDITIDRALTLNLSRIGELHEAKADGILNVMCHNCMLGTVTESLTSTLRKETGDTPICTLVYEGLKSTHNKNRLEAFAHQVKQRKK